MPDEKKGFIVRMLEFYGLKPNQTRGEFLAEIKTLSYAERQWFAKQLNAAGIPTEEPLPPAK